MQMTQLPGAVDDSEHPLVMSPFLLFNIYHTYSVWGTATPAKVRAIPGSQDTIHSFFTMYFWWSFLCKPWTHGQAHKPLFHHYPGGGMSVM